MFSEVVFMRFLQARTFPVTEAGVLQFRITRGRFRRRGVL